MTPTDLEKRVTAVEQRLEALDKRIQERAAAPIKRNWFEDIWGSFAGDPAFLEAMRYGREWRERENRKSLRSPKAKASKRKK